MVLRDADTGNEIIGFRRRGKAYLFLRDKDTKRFIRRLALFEVRLFSLIDYSIEEARKGNPIYADFELKTLCTPDDYFNLDTIKSKTFETINKCINELFGAYLVQLSEIKGFEYGSKIDLSLYRMHYKYKFVAIWKHHQRDRARTFSKYLNEVEQM